VRSLSSPPIFSPLLRHILMSPAIANPIGDSSNELWAGKSRNAKAQARHRAKRKAYIEQVLLSSCPSSVLFHLLNQVL
jgi:hypothetical protein